MKKYAYFFKIMGKLIINSLICIILLLLSYNVLWAQTKAEQKLNEYLIQAESLLTQNPKKAFELTKQATDLAREQEDIMAQAKCSLLLGKLFFLQAAYKQSLTHFLNVTQQLENRHAPRMLAETYNELGNLYYILKREEKVLTSHKKAHSLYQQVSDSLGVAETFGYIGHYYEKHKQYDSAKYYQNAALTLLEACHSSRGKSKILSHLGSIYEDLEEYQQAQEYFLRSLQLNDSVQQSNERISILNNLGDIAYKIQDYKNAEVYTMRALALAQKLHDLYQTRSALRDLSQLYAAQGDHSKAYAFLDSSVQYYKQIYSEEGLKQVARLETFFEAEKKEREISLLEKDRSINQLIICLVVAGLISSIIIAIMQVKRQKAQVQQKQELFVAQEKLMKAQLENKKLSEIQLRDQLDSKSRSLTSFSLHLLEKNQLLQQLKSELQLISKTDVSNPKRQIRNLTRNIDFNLSHEQDWQKFRQTFEEAHSAFFQKLSQRNPKLTHAEFKLAALMKMHLDSKEIAEILNISMDSLRIARYRLRKKLQLEKEMKLSSFLHSL